MVTIIPARGNGALIDLRVFFLGMKMNSCTVITVGLWQFRREMVVGISGSWIGTERSNANGNRCLLRHRFRLPISPNAAVSPAKLKPLPPGASIVDVGVQFEFGDRISEICGAEGERQIVQTGGPCSSTGKDKNRLEGTLLGMLDENDARVKQAEEHRETSATSSQERTQKEGRPVSPGTLGLMCDEQETVFAAASPLMI
nr:protein tesmin/TSO1-like CXC 5 isoform X1 [Ipomoea batatas]